MVVGAGPAGCAAAVQCRRLGVEALLCDRTGEAGGLVENAWLVENLPALAEPLPGPALARHLRRSLEREGIAVEPATLRALAPAEGGFLLGGPGLDVLCRAVVLAVGTDPLPLGVSGEAEARGERLFYDACSLSCRWPGARRVAVVGAGEAACDMALSLAAGGAEVVLATRGRGPRACRPLLARLAAEARVRRLAGACCRAVEMEEDGVCLRLDGAEDLRVEAVLVAVGRRSVARPFLEALGAEPGPSVATGRTGLLVAGDARLGGLGQVGIALGDGLLAATLLGPRQAGEGVADGNGGGGRC